jgi:hypothetical protein
MKTSLSLLTRVIFLGLLASGCSATGRSPGTMLESSSFDSCPWKFGESGLDVVRDESGWQQFLAQAKPNAGEVRSWQPNFKDGQRVIIYRLGQKNSAGFSVSYGTASLGSGNKLRLPIVQTRPALGMMQAMMITSPCVAGWLQTSPAMTVELIDSASNTILATSSF